MKPILFVQARITSKRFPKKILSKIGGLTLLEILLKKLKKIKNIKKIVVVIPDNKKNDLLQKILKKLKIAFFRGSEKNVLERFYFAPSRIIKSASETRR